MTRNILGMRGTGIVLVVLMSSIFFIIPQSAWGAVGINAQIPFYGTLGDAGGTPVTGTYDMVFKIYDAPTGGTVLWTGNHTSVNGNAVSVNKGTFSVMLGSGTGNTLTLDFNNDSYYLGITIGTDTEMTPRERLGASGYAINTNFLDGLDVSAFLRANQTLNQTLNIASSTSDTLVTLNQTGIGKILALGNGVDELISVLQNGNMGIGDANPATKLAVEGTVSALTFLSTEDALNSFTGPIEVLSGDNSSFGGTVSVSGDLVIAEGSRLYLGSEGSGLSFYQDTGVFDGNSLIMMPYGEALSGDADVKLIAPSTLSLFSNQSEDGPGLKLNADGSARIYSSIVGDINSRVFYIDFSSGAEITNGDLRVLNGNVTIAGFDALTPSLFVDGDGGLRVSSIAADAGTVSLEADTQGNIMATPSDERLKKNVRTIDDALDTLLALHGVRYEWKDTERFGSSTEVGFIAQELQTELPEVVRDTGEYLSVNTKNITAVIVEAIKELYDEVEGYFSRTEALEREVEDLRRELEVIKGELRIETLIPISEEPGLTPDVEITTDTIPTEEVLILEETPVMEEVPTNTDNVE